MLDPGRGKTKTGRLWAAVRDERPLGSTAPPAAFYLYSPDRKAEHARALLEACRGFLHADGYAGLPDLYSLTQGPAPPAADRGRLLGACAALYLRRACRHTIASRARGARDALRDLFAIEADISGKQPGRASARRASQHRRRPGRTEGLPQRHARQDQRQERSCRRHPLCDVALGGADSLTSTTAAWK